MTDFIKSVRIRSFSGPYFPAFGLNTKIYRLNLRIQSKCTKNRGRKTANTDNFYALTGSKIPESFFRKFFPFNVLCAEFSIQYKDVIYDLKVTIIW